MKTEQAMKVRKDSAHQTFQELLISIENLATHVANDNNVSSSLDSNFPAMIRRHQINSLKSLTTALDKTLNTIELSIAAEEGTQDGLDR